MQKILKNKKVCIALGVLALVLVIFFILLCTTKSRVVGVWQREVMYLEHYGCDAIMVVEFESDGDFNKVLKNAQTGKILKIESGYWKLSGFEISVPQPDGNGRTCYDFNPLTGTLKNGDQMYKKIA